MSQHDQNLHQKPGVKTTEFWVSASTPLVGGVVLSLLHKVGIPITAEVVETFVTGILVAPVTYILGRIYGKKKTADKSQ